VDGNLAANVLKNAVIRGREPEALDALAQLLAAAMPAKDILSMMSEAMKDVGERFQRYEFFLPDVLVAADAFQVCVDVLEPQLAAEGADRSSKGRVVIGVVEGDLHDIGKNLVSTMLNCSGFEVHDLGTNVIAETFVNEVRASRPHILAMSALMSTTMDRMPEVIERLDREGLRDSVKVMVGGAPVTARFARSIGADGYAEDASEAVAVASKIIAEVDGAEASEPAGGGPPR